MSIGRLLNEADLERFIQSVLDKRPLPKSPLPVGAVTAYAGSTAPDGWMLCDGSAIKRADYSKLFSLIGTTYGAGDGTTTFNLPDLRGRVPVGEDGAAGRLSANDALGQSGGSEPSNMPSHTHTLARDTWGGGAVGSHNVYALDSRSDFSTFDSTQAAGGGANNMQPYQVVNYIVRAL